MRKLVVVASICVIGTASANGFFWQIEAGPGWSYFQQGTQDVTVYNGVVNQYTTSPFSTINGFFGAGSAYQWRFNHVSFDLGLTG